MFCGECGSSSTATPATRKRVDPRPSDTTIIPRLSPTVVSVPIDSVPIDSVRIDSVRIDAGGRAPEEPATSDPAEAPDLEPPALLSEPEPEPEPEDVDEVEAFEAEEFVADEPSAYAPAAYEPGAYEPGAHEPEPDEPSEGWAPAEPYPAGTAGATFDLQFSTGEGALVSGSGLLGRRPLPQPSEVFDQLIQISDSGMSVSKSHLEFGQEDGEFWVSDRFSGNGTIILRPGESAVRCEPGRRYRVPRGTRVEIADQFFILR